MGGIVFVLFTAAVLSADDSPFAPRGSSFSAPPKTAAEMEELSPLDALKRRSPEFRWEERKSALGQPKSADGPSPGQTAETPTSAGRSLLKSESPSGANGGREAIREEIREEIPDVLQSPADLPPSTSGVSTSTAPYRFDVLPILEVIQQAAEPARDPSQLKRVTEILPYFDYEPDLEALKDDPCKSLCPRPDGKPCKVYPPGSMAPACPEEVSINGVAFEGRAVPASVFSWEASNLWHNPLYFEDPQLERYGHTHHELIQPFVSTGRFGAQLLGLPYQMTIDPIHKRMYTLGWYRPGDCAPYKHYQVPWNTHAAVTEASVLTGLFFLFP